MMSRTLRQVYAPVGRYGGGVRLRHPLLQQMSLKLHNLYAIMKSGPIGTVSAMKFLFQANEICLVQ